MRLDSDKYAIDYYTQHNEIVAVAAGTFNCYLYFPNQAHLGLMTSAQLRFIANELDRLNRMEGDPE